MNNNTTVIICTKNRAKILDETLRSLISQLDFTSNIIVSIGSKESLLPETAALPGVKVIDHVTGLTRQRNAALHLVTTKYSLFIDDDVELDAGYIRSMERLLDCKHDIALSTGEAVLDQPVGRTLVTRSMAVRALKKAVRLTGAENAINVPGHNMFVRTEVARSLGFDEVLPLYGYLEDLDFVIRCRQHGLVVRNREARIAHLGVLSGRINNVQMGYSQVANPWYLTKKGVLDNKRVMIKQFWVGQFLKNLVLSGFPSNSDRRGRLRGNILAMTDLLLGRLDPGNILTLG